MTNAADPKDFATYNDLMIVNNDIGGQGIGVFVDMPCPFCAAKHFCKYPIIGMQAILSKGATCTACGRSAKAIFEPKFGGVSFEIVQTGGDDPADWLQPSMRRV